MKVNIKKVHDEAVVPQYATDGSGCFDLVATSGGIVTHAGLSVNTGWEFEVPKGMVMLIFSRSGHGFNKAVRLANCVGVIDSDYRGEVKVKLTADHLPFLVNVGDRVAQAMIVPYEQAEFTISNKLSDTDRGSGGFGSTGS